MQDLLVLKDRTPPDFSRERFPIVKETRKSRMARGREQHPREVLPVQKQKRKKKNLLFLKDKTPSKFLLVKVPSVKETRKSCMARGLESLHR